MCEFTHPCRVSSRKISLGRKLWVSEASLGIFCPNHTHFSKYTHLSHSMLIIAVFCIGEGCVGPTLLVGWMCGWSPCPQARLIDLLSTTVRVAIRFNCTKRTINCQEADVSHVGACFFKASRIMFFSFYCPY